MTWCERYAELDAAERYVAGRMTKGEAEDFEQHFLACDACLATVQGIEDVRDVLAERRAAMGRGEVDPLAGATGAAGKAGAARAAGAVGAVGTAAPTRSWSTWAAAAAFAAAASVAVGIYWTRGASSSSVAPGSPASTAPSVARDGQPAPAPAPSTAPTAPGSSQTAPATASSSPQPPSPSPGAPSGAPAPPPGVPTTLIGRLAIVLPPPYVAVPVRGEGDDVQQVFAAAMTRYRARDYAGAAKGLRGLVEKSPDLASAQFYLGICELMTRQTRRAEAALRAAADSDVTPYADEAYFYLAKAALQREDLAAAERALTEAVAREAGPGGGTEARVLLEEVRALGRS